MIEISRQVAVAVLAVYVILEAEQCDAQLHVQYLLKQGLLWSSSLVVTHKVHVHAVWPCPLID